jgi:hypothetical protein
VRLCPNNQSSNTFGQLIAPLSAGIELAIRRLSRGRRFGLMEVAMKDSVELVKRAFQTMPASNAKC